MPRRIVSMCWYRRSDYHEARKIMVDEERFAPSYDEWKIDAERMESIIYARFETRRIFLRPSEFLEWCKMVELQPDAIARDRFVNEVVVDGHATLPLGHPIVAVDGGGLSLAM